ncbi:hypothetical protein WN944_014502 [Citrus x changshan-huyou]|uniref:Uncharacterized protein n=1 Tax=Citrus x changshan-huyou TaxID=2935761 RepID=A0AAP0QQ53_9ROSI
MGAGRDTESIDAEIRSCCRAELQPNANANTGGTDDLDQQLPSPKNPSINLQLDSLEYLSLSDNNLSGTIPPCLRDFSTRLIILQLKNNNVKDRILDTFVNRSCLTSLDLNSNK